MIGEENETFFIRVWKHLSSRCVLKSFEGKLERESLKRTISATGGLELLQMVSDPGTGDVSVKRLSLEGGWTRDGVPARTLGPEGGGLWVPHQLEKGMSGSEDGGPRRGWIVRSHIGWGGERNILYKGVETSL